MDIQTVNAMTKTKKNKRKKTQGVNKECATKNTYNPGNISGVPEG